jgi:membrane protein DedA with SNARE-associated domain
MSGIADFIREWGYVVVFLGSMIEGESVILTASALAAYGHMSIYRVFLIAFITTVLADHGLFWIGYKTGTDWLTKRFPKINKTKDRVFNLLHRMDIFFIFVFRFVYGIRTVSPLIIGSAKIKPSRFAVYNTLSGLCWATISCFIGYTVADVVMDGEFDTLPTILTIIILIIITSGTIGLAFKLIEKRNKEK